MKRMVGIFVLVCMLCQLAVHAFAVQTDDLQTEVISRVSGIGIINGDDEGFRLYDSITRAEFATIACRLMSIDNISKRVTGFADVPSAHWASGYVATAESLGIINGVGNFFYPENNLTRQDAAVIICRLLKKTSDGQVRFKDAKTISDYALPSVAYLSSIGVINGYSDNTFKPDDNITRAEVVEIIHTLYEQGGIVR